MFEKKDCLKLIKESIYIVITAAIIGFGVNIIHPKGYLFVSKEIFGYKKIVFISSDEAKTKYDSKSAVFIDSRSKEEYSELHIKNALNIPASPESTALQKIKENIAVLSEPNELVLYCTGTSCGSSEDLAKRLIDIGYKKHLYIIEHGFPEWEEKGYPTEMKKVQYHKR